MLYLVCVLLYYDRKNGSIRHTQRVREWYCISSSSSNISHTRVSSSSNGSVEGTIISLLNLKTPDHLDVISYY